jgi:hypothetical protein
MQEPVPIRVHDLDASAGAPDADDAASTTVAERLTSVLVELIASVTAAFLAAADDAADEGLRDIAAAGGGFAIEACRAFGQIAAAIERGLAGPAAATARSPIVGDLLAHWRAIYRDATDDEASPSETTQGVLDRVLEQVDLTALIRSHVDLQAIARDLDVNALLEGLDVDALADRIDVNALAAGIDVDALASRIDLDALVARLDLPRIASEVIDELDLADLVRDATAETASDGVRTARLRGVDADRAVRRAVDRVLSRRDGSSS